MSESPPSSSTWVTRLTTAAAAAIAVVELSGPSSEVWLTRCWKPASKVKKSIGAIRFGHWFGLPQPATKALQDNSLPANSIIDASNLPYEEVLVCWTSNETVEIHCHGGLYAAERIIDTLVELGAVRSSSESRLIRIGNDAWTIDALIDLDKTTTEITTAIMLDQFRGALSEAMQTIQTLIDQGHSRQAISMIDELLKRYSYGEHLIAPWKLAIVGPPNVGKSSLLNVILGYQRAIVNPRPGTTRDLLHEATVIMGWPFTIIDTAGVREADERIELEGVRRALSAVESSDLIVLLVEPRQGWTDWHTKIFDAALSKCLIVHSKIDLALPRPTIPSTIHASKWGYPASIGVSGLTGQGLEEFYEAIIAKVVPEPPLLGQAVPFRDSHRRELEQWRQRLS